MAGEPVITVTGNLAADPELRFTTNGTSVATFTVLSTPRTYDRNSGQWREGETLALRCSVWRDMAQHVSESVSKGSRVVVTGRLRQRSFQDREGNQRTTVEIDVDEVAPSLRFTTATPRKVERASAPAADPWTQPTSDSAPF